MITPNAENDRSNALDHLDRRFLLGGLAGVAGVSALAALTGRASAGPLSPPAGPVASTAKPLGEIEPRTAVNATNTPGDATALFRITQPGSYYLTGNITGAPGKHGIAIDTSGVTLDLNGFDVVGTGVGTNGVYVIGASRTSIAVLNGSVRGWGGQGINMMDSNASCCRIEGVRSSGNAGHGITGGVACVISGCVAFGNSGTGIVASQGSSVVGCVAHINQQHGISALSSSSVTGCVANLNIGNGILASNACSVSACSAKSNNGEGIVADAGSTVSDCGVQFCLSNGIHITNGSSAIGCAVQGCNNGINAGDGCMVMNCTVRANTADGIVANSTCLIRGNTCAFNGTGNGAGIHILASGNQVDGNICTGADRGIDVDALGNFINRNVCRGNTFNYDIAFGNIVLAVNAATAGLVSGNSGGTAPGSADPNANFSF